MKQLKIIAHRGASGYEIENTLASFSLAKKLKSDGIEMDVRLSRDKVPLVFHDKTLLKLAQLPIPLSCIGINKIKNILLRLPGKQSRRVATLEEIFKKFSGIEMDIELKIKEKEGIKKILLLAGKYAPPGKFIVSSYDFSSLVFVKSLFPRAKVAWIGYLFTETSLQKAADAGFNIIKPYCWFSSRKLGESAARKGMKAYYWGANHKFLVPWHAKRLFKHGADALITNYPDIARNAIHEIS